MKSLGLVFAIEQLKNQVSTGEALEAGSKHESIPTDPEKEKKMFSLQSGQKEKNKNKKHIEMCLF